MIYKNKRNWTSTTTPMWEGDMMNFWRAGGPFEVREVANPQHREVVERFAREYSMELTERGKTLILTPRGN